MLRYYHGCASIARSQEGARPAAHALRAGDKIDSHNPSVR